MSKKESEWIAEGLIKKNEVNVMTFHHDNWCNKLKNMSKECNCNPDITTGQIKK